MGGRQLLDPRWHWMRDALTRLYNELEPDAVPATLTVLAVNGEEMISYTIAPHDPEIERRVIVNPSALIAAAQVTTVDASVEAEADNG
jgi:hypothetical protein